MIYLKRFCLIIVTLFLLIFYCFSVLLEIITLPIWGTLYYVITGKDPIREDIWDFFSDLIQRCLDWYMNKFGPND